MTVDVLSFGKALASDTAVTGAAFVATHYLYKWTKSYLARSLPSWDKVSSFNQNRLSCEIAMLPTRFIIFLCCTPGVLNAFEASGTWTAVDTSRTLLVCCLLAGSYSFDLTVERADILSLIHHCVGPVMILWIRACFATFTEDDATMGRILTSFIFFGTGVGGSLTTLMLVLMKLMKSHVSEKMLYQGVSILSWGLTLNTFASTMFGTWYVLYWADPLWEYWGLWSLCPLIPCTFEFYLQWRWALRFQAIVDKLGEKAGAESKTIEIPNVAAQILPAIGISKTRMRAKTIGLIILLSSWGLSYFTIFAKAAQRTSAYLSV